MSIVNCNIYGSETWPVGKADRSRNPGFGNVVLAKDDENLLERAKNK